MLEITATIYKEFEPREGVSQASGRPWKMVDYVAEWYEGMDLHRVLFTVSDGENGRIAWFNLQAGKKYHLRLDVNANEYNDRWYNKFRCIAAQLADGQQ